LQTADSQDVKLMAMPYSPAPLWLNWKPISIKYHDSSKKWRQRCRGTATANAAADDNRCAIGRALVRIAR
jgi:hypothetical protein